MWRVTQVVLVWRRGSVRGGITECADVWYKKFPVEGCECGDLMGYEC